MSRFKDRLHDVRFNPHLMHRVVLEELADSLDGRGNYDIPDPSNPWVQLSESSVLVTSMGMEENEALLRRIYASMAISEDELYLHMSDQDYLGRFATPAMTTFDLILSRDEIVAKAVAVPGSRIRRLTIPRLTEFHVAGTHFTMQYPIDIQLMSHGGLQITYNTEHTSPIQTLSTNMVDWDVIRIEREQLVVLHIPVYQMRVSTFTETLNAAAGYNNDYGYMDEFYTARVFVSRGGRWEEIRTTHTDQVYDPLKLTAVLKVTRGNLHVEIPMVYFSQGMLAGGEIRVDIYTTKGVIDIDLGSYEPTQFGMHMNAIDDDKTYVAPLTTFSRIQTLNPHRVEGGANMVTFETLRDQVINNTLGQGGQPITQAQLNNELTRRGYRVVTNIDHITNRQFIAARLLPRPPSHTSTGPMGCMMGQFQHSMTQLTQSSHVVAHTDRVTLLPSALYEYKDGRVTRVPDTELRSLSELSPEALVSQLNQRRYLYTPFHYVLDGRFNRFEVRPYYIDQPTITHKVFVDENDSSEMQISVDTYDIKRIESGFRITLQLRSSERVKELDPDDVIVQMSYRPRGERSYASINGELIGGNPGQWRYQFDIETNYDFDRDHHLRTLNFSMFNLNQREFYLPLEADLDVTFIVAGQDMRFYDLGVMDNDVSTHLLPHDVMVVSRERLHVRFGMALTSLWQRGRSLLSEASYKRYTADVPYLYEQTIYKRDEDGQLVLSQDASGNVVYEVLHEIGDPVLDDQGRPRFRYLKGDTILDSQGKPELVEPRKLMREYTLFLMDGLYYFVDDPLAREYRDSVPGYITSWLENDIDYLKGQLLEQSSLYLHPTTTFGDTMLNVGQDERQSLSLSQGINVEYYLTQTAYLNASLREALIRQTRETVSEMLEREVISISQITSRLRTLGGDDVIEVRVSGLGGHHDYRVVSITDDAMRLTLGKRAVLLPNQLITVQDDIDIAFKRHAAL